MTTEKTLTKNSLFPFLFRFFQKKQEQARRHLGQRRQGPRGRGGLPQGPRREAQLRPRVDKHGVREREKRFSFLRASERGKKPDFEKGKKLKTNFQKNVPPSQTFRIASANLGDYLSSSRYYARALALNPTASSVWGYLRTSLACAGRADLLEAADREDAAAIERALPL